MTLVGSSPGLWAGCATRKVVHHDVFDDPQFVNPSVDPTVADFHLLADSPAIGAGMDGLDIGAYEYTGGVQPSPTPTPTATSQATSTPTPTPRPNPHELVIDNSDSEFSTNFAQDPWREYVQVGGQHYGDSHYYNDQPGVGEDTATWSFDVLQPGKYEVHAWWWEGSRRPSDVPYTVHHLGGSTIVKVDQQANGGQWNLLGAFDFQDQGSVVISDDVSSGQGIVADAVRLVYLEPLPSPTARPNLTQRIWLPVVRN